MQILLEGISPLFWQQVSELPTGIYNKNNFQASSATIPQVLTAFVDLAVGTEVDIYVSVDNGNLSKMASAKVIDNTGFLYAKFPIPYSRSLDSIEIVIKEHGPHFDSQDKTIAAEAFASSHIAYMFEIQAKAADPELTGAVQLEQNTTIDGVEDSLLEYKFGSFTGLTRRADQTINDYRAQTACIWAAFQYAGTEKGVTDSIACVIGDYTKSESTITVIPVKSIIPNEIFDEPQFGDSGTVPGYFPDDPAASGIRWDDDYPHYYVPEYTDSASGYHPDTDVLPLLEDLGPFATLYNHQVWDYDTVQVLTIYTNAALGNEVLAQASSATSLGIPEDAAIAAVQAEEVFRRNPAVGYPETGDTNPDYTVNPYVASQIHVKKCVINGIELTDEALMPKEDGEFTVDRLDGTIVWNDAVPGGTGQIPDIGTTYMIDYNFRLDNQLKAVLKQIKPAQKNIVVYFVNTISGLPKSVKI